MRAAVTAEINEIATKYEYRYPKGSPEYNAWHRVKELSAPAEVEKPTAKKK